MSTFIDSIDVKTPCSEDWGEMKGGEKIRFCSHCSKSVNNISAMTRKQAMRLVRDAKGGICVRYVKNPKTNAPVFAGKLYQISRRAGLAAGVLGASLALSALTYAQNSADSIKRESVSQTEVFEEKQSEEDKTESPSASVSGTIADPNGAVIPNAIVMLRSDENSEFLITTSSDESGFYEFKNLAAGKYRLLTNGGAGFSGKEVAGIEVSAGNKTEQNIAVDLAELTFEVEVSLPVTADTTVMGGIGFTEFQNPLTRAVSDNDLEAVKNLIAKGENVNGKDENYNDITPLFLAVENGSVEIVETLLNFGAKVNAKDKNKQTPLMRLDEDATPELVRLLINRGAKVNLIDSEGNTALILAAHFVKAGALQILIDHDAEINAQNSEGQTALMNAADADNAESVRALILAGADVNLKNKDGETALDLTASDEIEEMLKTNGATVEEN